MKIKLDVDTKKMEKLLGEEMTEQGLKEIEYPTAMEIVNRQRMLVPADTAATKLSIGQHIVESSKTKIVDDIGPETEYSLYLEYGTGIYAENGKGRKGGWFYKDNKGWHFTMGMKARPYIRPSVEKNAKKLFQMITSDFTDWLEKRYG